MRQVLLHLSFRNTQYPSELIGGHMRACQEVDDALAERAIGGQHVRMIRTESKKDQMI